MFGFNQLPKTAAPLPTIDDMIGVTARLTEILNEETALLAVMKIKETTPLQEEKLTLSKQLESFQRLVAADDTPVRTADAERRHALMTLTDNLMDTVEENMRRTVVAQNINKRVMQTIVEAMNEQQRLGVYGSMGQANSASEITLSVNLNEKA